MSERASTSMTRMRVAFIALGIALIGTVAGLLSSAVSRLEEQRLLRHRMVAERVFDEIEREISTVLQHESERPSEAYDAVTSEPSRWWRFVDGYYRRDPELVIVAEASLPTERATRVREAALAARGPLAKAKAATQQGTPREAAARRAPRDESEREPAARSPDVLRQLNRGVKVRERRLHDFVAAFTVVRVGRSTVVAERSVADGRLEGFVIDVPELIATMESWVLHSQELDAVASIESSADAPKDPRGERYEFRHALAAPFETQAITLRLARLDDEDASSTLYGLAALLAAAAVLGLWAIYRMVAVQLRFAERRNNFVAAVTHELRTPLTSIRMYGEMLRDGMVQDEATRKEYYATITAEGERLTRLINNVMEHGRLRRGQRHAHLEPADVAAVMREVVDVMKPHIEHEGFAVELRVGAGLPRVLLDVDALKQVLFNVIDNALKYGRGEAARIEVACDVQADASVAVSVRDFGPGVQPAQLATVFEPFFRGESELTRRHKGTGLGLSLVRDLVESMGGRVRGENRAPGFEVQIALRAA